VHRPVPRRPFQTLQPARNVFCGRGLPATVTRNAMKFTMIGKIL